MITRILNKSNFLKEIKKILIALISVFVFLIFWANKTKFYPENVLLWAKNMFFLIKTSKSDMCDFSSDNILKQNIGKTGNNFVITDDNSFVILDNNNFVIREQRHSFSNPCMKSRGSRAIIYDIGGKKISIETVCGNLLNTEQKNNIISCDISENGTYGVLTSSPSYLSELKIYSEKNVEKYAYYFSENYICDIEINSTGEECVCCGVSTENGDINSCVYLLDFKQKKPKFKLQINDNFVTKIKYLNNKNIIAVGDNFVSIINLSSKSVKNYLYNNKFVKFCDIKKDKGICYCLVSDLELSKNYEIHVINTLKKENIFTINCSNIKDMLYTGNRIFILCDSELRSYNLNGKLEKSINIDNNAKIIFGNSNSFLYIVNKNRINKIKF